MTSRTAQGAVARAEGPLLLFPHSGRPRGRVIPPAPRQRREGTSTRSHHVGSLAHRRCGSAPFRRVLGQPGRSARPPETDPVRAGLAGRQRRRSRVREQHGRPALRPAGPRAGPHDDERPVGRADAQPGRARPAPGPDRRARPAADGPRRPGDRAPGRAVHWGRPRRDGLDLGRAARDATRHARRRRRDRRGGPDGDRDRRRERPVRLAAAAGDVAHRGHRRGHDRRGARAAGGPARGESDRPRRDGRDVLAGAEPVRPGRVHDRRSAALRGPAAGAGLPARIGRVPAGAAGRTARARGGPSEGGSTATSAAAATRRRRSSRPRGRYTIARTQAM